MLDSRLGCLVHWMCIWGIVQTVSANKGYFNTTVPKEDVSFSIPTSQVATSPLWSSTCHQYILQVERASTQLLKAPLGYLGFADGDHDASIVATTDKAAPLFFDRGQLQTLDGMTLSTSTLKYAVLEKFPSVERKSATWNSPKPGQEINFVDPAFTVKDGHATFCTARDHTVFGQYTSKAPNCKPVKLIPYCLGVSNQTSVIHVDGTNTVVHVDHSGSNVDGTHPGANVDDGLHTAPERIDLPHGAGIAIPASQVDEPHPVAKPSKPHPAAKPKKPHPAPKRIESPQSPENAPSIPEDTVTVIVVRVTVDCYGYTIGKPYTQLPGSTHISTVQQTTVQQTTVPVTLTSSTAPYRNTTRRQTTSHRTSTAAVQSQTSKHSSAIVSSSTSGRSLSNSTLPSTTSSPTTITPTDTDTFSTSSTAEPSNDMDDEPGPLRVGPSGHQQQPRALGKLRKASKSEHSCGVEKPKKKRNGDSKV